MENHNFFHGENHNFALYKTNGLKVNIPAPRSLWAWPSPAPGPGPKRHAAIVTPTGAQQKELRFHVEETTAGTQRDLVDAPGMKISPPVVGYDIYPSGKPWEKPWKNAGLMGFYGIYLLVMSKITIENCHL